MLSMEAVKVMTQLKELKVFSKAVFKHCVAYVSPQNLIDKELSVKDGQLQVKGETYPLKNNFYIVGFGKAVLEMGRATETVLNNHLQSGILSVPEGTVDKLPPHSKITVFEGAQNNLPDPKAEMTAKRVAELIAPLTANDVLIVLISGGGSALLPYPVPPVTLQEKRTLTELLAKKGANIIELNSVRKQLSLLKGGKLARLAYPSRVVSLIISDVINDKLDFIAAGPTVANSTTSSTALEILKKYDLLEKTPKSVLEVLNKGFPQEPADAFSHTQNVIIGNNHNFLVAGCEVVKKGGDRCFIMSSCVEGNVEDVSVALAKLSTLICKIMARTINKTTFTEAVDKLKSTLCMDSKALKQLETALATETIVNKIVLLFGGETTVKVTGSGKGGRNQELALRFSLAIDEISSQEHVNRLFNILMLSCGTDGIDGPTDAAGAVGYNGMTDLAKKKNLSPMKYINDNDSYNFYAQMDSEDHIKIGHTGTNVMDVMILTIQSKA